MSFVVAVLLCAGGDCREVRFAVYGAPALYCMRDVMIDAALRALPGEQIGRIECRRAGE